MVSIILSFLCLNLRTIYPTADGRFVVVAVEVWHNYTILVPLLGGTKSFSSQETKSPAVLLFGVASSNLAELFVKALTKSNNVGSSRLGNPKYFGKFLIVKSLYLHKDLRTQWNILFQLHVLGGKMCFDPCDTVQEKSKTVDNVFTLLSATLTDSNPDWCQL